MHSLSSFPGQLGTWGKKWPFGYFYLDHTGRLSGNHLLNPQAQNSVADKPKIMLHTSKEVSKTRLFF